MSGSNPLPLGTRVRYRPHHPGLALSPFIWRIIGVRTEQYAWQPQPVVYYTLSCESALPGPLAMDYTVRGDMVFAIEEE